MLMNVRATLRSHLVKKPVPETFKAFTLVLVNTSTAFIYLLF